MIKLEAYTTLPITIEVWENDNHIRLVNVPIETPIQVDTENLVGYYKTHMFHVVKEAFSVVI